MNATQFKQHQRDAIHHRTVLFVIKHNWRNGRDTETNVFDERFRTQAKLPLRKHGLSCERQTIQERLPKRKRNTETIALFYERFRIRTTLYARRNYRNQCVFWWRPLKLKQHQRDARRCCTDLFVNVKQLKHNYWKGRDRSNRLFCLMNVPTFTPNRCDQHDKINKC